MPHSQGLPNNSYPELKQPNFLYWYLFFKIHSNIFLHLPLGLCKSLFPVGLPFNILKALLPSSILATRPVHLNLLDSIILTIVSLRYKLRSSSLWSLFQSQFSCLLSPNICLRILFSNTLVLKSSISIRHHVSQSCSTTGNFIYLFNLGVKAMKPSSALHQILI